MTLADASTAPAGSLSLSATLAQLNAYLARWPQETQALAALARQMSEESGERLSDRSNLRGHVTASLLALDAAGEQALLIEHKQIGLWIPPGGHFEADIGLWLAALRETHEETGLPIEWPAPSPLLREGELIVPLDIDTHPIPARAAKKESAHFHHDFMFLAQIDRPFSPVRQEAEVDAAAWLPLAELGGLEHSRMSKIAAKLRQLGVLRLGDPQAGKPARM